MLVVFGIFSFPCGVTIYSTQSEENSQGKKSKKKKNKKEYKRSVFSLQTLETVFFLLGIVSIEVHVLFFLPIGVVIV